jgi:hypothetical protein
MNEAWKLNLPAALHASQFLPQLPVRNSALLPLRWTYFSLTLFIRPAQCYVRIFLLDSRAFGLRTFRSFKTTTSVTGDPSFPWVILVFGQPWPDWEWEVY